MCHALIFFKNGNRFANVSCTGFLLRTDKGSPMCHALIFFKNGNRFANVSCTGLLFRTEKGSPMCHALVFFLELKKVRQCVMHWFSFEN